MLQIQLVVKAGIEPETGFKVEGLDHTASLLCVPILCVSSNINSTTE